MGHIFLRQCRFFEDTPKMRTVDEVVSMPEVVCTIMAVQVSKVMAVNLLRRGATVVLSQVTNEGRGIQLLKLGEKYFHWMAGVSSGSNSKASSTTGSGVVGQKTRSMTFLTQSWPGKK